MGVAFGEALFLVLADVLRVGESNTSDGVSTLILGVGACKILITGGSFVPCQDITSWLWLLLKSKINNFLSWSTDVVTGSGVTHLLEPEPRVLTLAKVGAGVKGRESVSV